MIVDDSVLVRRGLSNLLRGIESLAIVGEAGDVQGALHAIEALKPDVVVLDFNLPDGSGLDVLVQVKARKQSPTVILFTSHTSKQLREQCIEAGADHFFHKTTEFRELVRLLRKMSGERNAPAPRSGENGRELVNH